jgi:hypothetical protein
MIDAPSAQYLSAFVGTTGVFRHRQVSTPVPANSDRSDSAEVK